MSRMNAATARGLGLLAGYAADRLFGDLRRGHPVAGFGSLAQRLEDRIHADSRARGILHNVLLVGGAGALGSPRVQAEDVEHPEHVEQGTRQLVAVA